MRHGSLFSGIGGFDLAAQWVGWENVFQVEWDQYCQKVLKKNFKGIDLYGDIKEFNGTKYRGTVDIVSGGFPCQPFSQAGKRKGQADDRYLWPEMLRVIGEVKPSWVVGENVAGLTSMEDGKTLERILDDLEDQGYKTEVFNIPACGVGAAHKRERLWITAHNESIRQCSKKTFRKLERGVRPTFGNFYDINGRLRVCEIKSFSSGEAHGIPRRVDRLKGLGNAIVPQVAYEIFKAIDNESKDRN